MQSRWGTALKFASYRVLENQSGPSRPEAEQIPRIEGLETQILSILPHGQGAIVQKLNLNTGCSRDPAKILGAYFGPDKFTMPKPRLLRANKD